MTQSIPNNVVRVYKDIDMTMTIHPIKKDINKMQGEYAVINSVKNLLLTDHYERPFQPQLGSNVRKLLFEPLDAISAQALNTEIQNTLTNFEPRIEVINVKSNADYKNNGFNVTLLFRMINSITPITINFFLERVR